MNKIVVIFFFGSFIIANSLDTWFQNNKNILNGKIKEVSFSLNIVSSEIKGQLEGMYLGKITVASDNQFRFELGPRIVLCNGDTCKIYVSPREYKTKQGKQNIVYNYKIKDYGNLAPY